jgi:class 3 adenylate cyclase
MTEAVSSFFEVAPRAGWRDVLPRPVRGFVVGGAIAIAVYYLLPSGFFRDTVYYPLFGFCAAAAIVAGVVMYRPVHRLPWLLLAAGQALFALGDVLFGVYEHVLKENVLPSPADGFYLAGYPTLAAGLWLLVRERSSARDWEGLIDAAIITVALGVLAWELLMVPYTKDTSLTGVEKVFSIAYPLGDVLLLAVAARLLLGSGVKAVSYGLLALAIVLLLVADPLYSLLSINRISETNPVAIGWMLSYVLFGAAALHPSMRVVSEPAPESVARLTPLRIVLLAIAALIAPAVLVFRPERAAIAAAAVLFVLVLARLIGIVRRHERAIERESRLREAAAMLVAATSDAEIHRAAVRTARAFAGGSLARATLVLEGGVPVAEAGDAVEGAVRTEFRLVIRGEPRGVLAVECPLEPKVEDRNALETLAAQVALALETIARAREQAEAERERVREMFARFVPEAVVEELLAQADGTPRLGGETCEGTIMFTDLRSFTSFSESRSAEEVIAVINRFLSAQTETIMAHGGTIIAYLGDGIMAAFGAPLEQADHADRALAAASELVCEALPRLNVWMAAQGYGDGFRMGIGLNSGAFVSGNVGSERRLEYTAIGDVCNTASRIQDLTKGTRHMLLLSDGTLAALSRRPDDLVEVGETAIRGRQAAAKLWSIERVSDPPTP